MSNLNIKKALSHLTNKAIKLANVLNTYVTTLLEHTIYFPFFWIKHPDLGNLYKEVFILA